jgi:hypothetical protein
LKKIKSKKVEFWRWSLKSGFWRKNFLKISEVAKKKNPYQFNSKGGCEGVNLWRWLEKVLLKSGFWKITSCKNVKVCVRKTPYTS